MNSYYSEVIVPLMVYVVPSIVLGRLCFLYLEGYYSPPSTVVRTITDEQERISLLEEENQKLREENATLAWKKSRTEYR